MLDYEKANIVRYQRPTFDFGGGADDKLAVLGPKGKSGLLVDYGVYDVSEAFAAGTALPQLSVGTAADPDAYGEEYSMGALAADSGGKSVLSSLIPGTAAFDAVMVNRVLPADTAVVLTMIAGTGAGLTGMATAFMDIIWQK